MKGEGRVAMVREEKGAMERGGEGVLRRGTGEELSTEWGRLRQ